MQMEFLKTTIKLFQCYFAQVIQSRLFECVCSKTTFVSSETVATGTLDSPQDDLNS